MSVVDRSYRLSYFFDHLVHPAFIASSGSKTVESGERFTEQLKVLEGNRVLTKKLQEAGVVEDIKDLTVGDCIEHLFSDEEQEFKADYLNAVDWIFSMALGSLDKKQKEIPKFKTLLLQKDVAQNRYFIRTTQIQGFRSTLLQEETSIYVDVFSIPQRDKEDTVIGLQCVLPMVNPRREQYLEFIRTANRSAIAVVMARNSSHNIGSHVLSRLVEPDAITFDRITSDDYSDYKTTPRIGRTKQEVIAKNMAALMNRQTNQEKGEDVIRQLAKRDFYDTLISYFFSYLKTRMDLLADIVTSTPKTQNAKLLVKEILGGFDKNRILLNRISGIDSFRYCFGLSLPQGKEDVLVGIYNDIMGQHCFYIILENIIRNSAKHGYTKLQKLEGENPLVEFVIDVDDCKHNSSYYQITVSDNIPVKGEHEYPEEENIPQALAAKIYPGTRTVANVDRLVHQQNRLINRKILDPRTNTLRQSALGLIEMEVCAAYLRGIPVERIEAPDLDIKFSDDDVKTLDQEIRAGRAELRLLTAMEVNGCLGYRFYLPKPKEVLVIDQTGEVWHKIVDMSAPEPFHKLKALEGYGITVLNDEMNKSGSIPDRWRYHEALVYPHSIIVINANNERRATSNLQSRRSIHLRTVMDLFGKYKEQCVLPEEQKQALKFDLLQDPDKWIVEVWRAYIYERYRKKSLHIERKRIHTRFFLDLPEVSESVRSYKMGFFKHGRKYIGNSNMDYLEIYGSRYDDLVTKIKDHSSPYNLSKFKFLDAVVTNVLVLDERIQEQADTRYALEQNEHLPSLSYRDIWSNVNVYIPEKEELDLNKQQFSERYIDAVQTIIEEQFLEASPRPCKQLDFLVVHLGVLEKILMHVEGRSKDDPRDIQWLLNELTKNTQGSRPRFILSSGRAPTELPENISYISYSILSQYLIENRFKYHLNEMLNAARPKN